MVKIEEMNPANANLAAPTAAPIAPRPAPDAGTVEEDDTPSMARLRRWIDEDQGGWFHKGIAWASERTGYEKWGIFWMGCCIVGVVMIRTPVLAPIICNLISVATYSMKGTLTALAHRQWDELGNWLVYWLVFQAISVFDYATHPLYLPFKTALLAWFHLPPLFGARFLRRRWIDPLLYSGEKDVAAVMKRAHPWLLTYVFELTEESMNAMNEQQLYDYVHLKRFNYFRSILGRPPIVPPEPNKPADSSLPSDPATFVKPGTNGNGTAQPAQAPTDQPPAPNGAGSENGSIILPKPNEEKMRNGSDREISDVMLCEKNDAIF